MKFRRSERLIDMTTYLLEHPRQLVSLTYFAEKYGSAKSSISEDLAIIKETFEQRGIGVLQTVPGAAGGVKFHVNVHDGKAKDMSMPASETRGQRKTTVRLEQLIHDFDRVSYCSDDNG